MDPTPQISMAFNQNNNYDALPVEPTSAPSFESLHQRRLEQWHRRQQQLMQHSVDVQDPTTAAAGEYCNYNPYEYSGNDTAPPMYYPDLYGIQESFQSYVEQQQQLLKREQLMEQLLERVASMSEVDRKCPFLTPWSPDFVAPRRDSKPSGEPGSDEYMEFQPGSFCSHEVDDFTHFI